MPVNILVINNALMIKAQGTIRPKLLPQVDLLTQQSNVTLELLVGVVNVQQTCDMIGFRNPDGATGVGGSPGRCGTTGTNTGKIELKELLAQIDIK